VFRPREFIENGYFSALGKVAAHYYYRIIGRDLPPRRPEMERVPVVQGIVFAYRATNFQNITSKYFIFFIKSITIISGFRGKYTLYIYFTPFPPDYKAF